ncbi:MAG: glutaredoxin 3 [Desulfuromonadales bacterium]|nr:glutaredoxin 3 [Desulfuromonadales bacterium]
MKVEIYTKPYCPYCERAKELLRIKGIAFVEYVINGDPHRAEEMRRRGVGETFPGIFIADRLIGGCGELFDLDERGVLDQLLSPTPG